MDNKPWEELSLVLSLFTPLISAMGFTSSFNLPPFGTMCLRYIGSALSNVLQITKLPPQCMRGPKEDVPSDSQEQENEALKMVSSIDYRNAPVQERNNTPYEAGAYPPLCTILQEMVVSERSPDKSEISTEEALFATTSLHEVQ